MFLVFWLKKEKKKKERPFLGVTRTSSINSAAGKGLNDYGTPPPLPPDTNHLYLFIYFIIEIWKQTMDKYSEDPQHLRSQVICYESCLLLSRESPCLMFRLGWPPLTLTVLMPLFAVRLVLSCTLWSLVVLMSPLSAIACNLYIPN